MKTRKRLSSIVNFLEKQIYSGQYKKGEYMPGVRSISQELGCSTVTAHRAMQQLAGKELVHAEPCHGYKVINNTCPDSIQSVVVAFLDDTVRSSEYLGGVYNTQNAMIQQEAALRDWFTVILPYKGQTTTRIKDQLKEMNASVLVVQNANYVLPAELLKCFSVLEMPVVSLDAPYYVPGIDHVCRDEIAGAALAAEYLVKKGYRRIGWYGSLSSQFGVRRYSGAASVMLKAGIEGNMREWRHLDGANRLDVAREYIAQPDRPQAILSLWQGAAGALVRAAEEAELTVGEDIEIVGWGLEEHLSDHYVSSFRTTGVTSPFVTWSMKSVAELLMNRIRERLEIPGIPDACIYSPMRLNRNAPVVLLAETK